MSLGNGILCDLPRPSGRRRGWKAGRGQGESPRPAGREEDFRAASPQVSDLVHLWYADDSAAGGTLSRVRRLWDILVELGPSVGYHPNASKTHLVVKPAVAAEARRIFEGTGVKITTEGQRHLGATIGDLAFRKSYVEGKVTQWSLEVCALAEFASVHPRRSCPQNTLDQFTGLSDKRFRSTLFLNCDPRRTRTLANLTDHTRFLETGGPEIMEQGFYCVRLHSQ